MLEASILLFYILLQKGISLQPYIIVTGHYFLFESYFFFGSDIPDTLVYLDGRHHYSTHTTNSHILATFQSPKVSIFSQFVMSLVKHRLKTG